MNIKNTVTELIGNTPLIRLKKMEERFGAKGEIVAKVELFNPAGSIKDRVGYNMIIEAEKSGRLKPGGTIIEPTSGNTGVGIAMTAAARGYKAIMVMPESMSVERRKLLAALGAELVLTDKALGMKGSLDKADELAKEIPGSIIAGQFENPANPQAHYETTGPEIWRDTDGHVDILVAGVGTGGTLCGTAAGLKRHNSSLKAYAVEPDSSPVLSGGKAGPHKIQGIGANFIPGNFVREYVDGVIRVKNDDAIRTGRELSLREGLLVGISSGAAAWAALELARKPENAGKRIVAVLPDTGERYLSTELYAFDSYPL